VRSEVGLSGNALSRYTQKPMYAFGGAGLACFLMGLLTEMLTDISRIAGEVPLARQSDPDHCGQRMDGARFTRGAGARR